MKFITWPAMKITPFFFVASIISEHSLYESAIGFSQNTCFLFLAASKTASLCAPFGDATIIASISSLAHNS